VAVSIRKGLTAINPDTLSMNAKSGRAPLRLLLLALLLLQCSCMAIMIAEDNNHSLDFYGVVIDQWGNPVPNVLVTAKVGTYVSFSEGGGEDSTTKTDRQGRFSFTGLRGAGVGYLLELKGYEYDQRQASTTRPNDYVPDPSKPVVFKIRKLLDPVPLHDVSISAGIPCDGTPTSFDPVAGGYGGDLVVTLLRTPVHIDRKVPFDWTLTLTVKNGGLVEATGPYPYEAPAEGYLPSVSYTEKASEKPWSPQLRKSYYFESNGGKIYGRIDVVVYSNFEPPPTMFHADVSTNPSGSRILESADDDRPK
jgi:hypothetical protein